MIEKLLRNHPVVTMALVVVSFMIVVCSWLVDEIGIPRWAILAFAFLYVFINLAWLILLGRRLWAMCRKGYGVPR